MDNMIQNHQMMDSMIIIVFIPINSINGASNQSALISILSQNSHLTQLISMGIYWNVVGVIVCITFF